MRIQPLHAVFGTWKIINWTGFKGRGYAEDCSDNMKRSIRRSVRERGFCHQMEGL